MKEGLKQNKLVKIIIYIFGLILIFLGLTGLFLPVIPGFVLIFFGLVILGEGSFLSKFILKKLPVNMRNKIVRKKEK